MELFDWLLAGTGALYGAALCWLIAGLGRLPRRGRSEERPAVSIVVAARDEERAIGACLSALRRQQYGGALEVIVVDDRSQDGTAAKVAAAARTWPRLKLVRALARPRFRCPKKSALAQGIEASCGELLLFTDADCRPAPAWVSSTVGFFAAEVGLVAGHARPRPGPRWRHKVLALDQLAVGALGAGSFGMGAPLACSGRNLAYRRRVYDEVGGFERIGHLVGGDDVYFARLVAAHTNWRLVYHRDAQGEVVADPGPGRWAGILQQKLRHAAKAGHYRGPALLLAVLVYGFHLLLFAGLAQMALAGQWNMRVLGIWGGRWALDLVLLARFAREREEFKLLVFLPLLELCYIPYVLLFSVAGRLGWFRWKN